MNNNQLPTVSIVFPTRNRQDHLPTFLEHIYALDYPKKNISIATIINDSIDDSEQILQNFKKKHEHEYNKINIKRYDMGTPTYDSNRYSYVAPKIIQSNGIQRVITENITHTKVYKNLAKHRNSLVHNADTDFIFSIDTDIFCKPDTLKKLLEHNLDYVSAHICNGYVVEKLNGKRAYDYTNAMYYDENTKINIHYPYETNSGLVECSNTGAVFCISKKAYKSGSRFDGHVLGEDYPFCQGLIARGFTLYCDTNLKAAHCMDLELLEQYKNGEWKY
jgi:glycosyltransferase involved in cell wall biosynthesis